MGIIELTIEDREEFLPFISEENRQFLLDLEQGKATTIPQQIATA